MSSVSHKRAQPETTSARLTAKADFGPGVNSVANSSDRQASGPAPLYLTKVANVQELSSPPNAALAARLDAPTGGAGYHETQNGVNHAQVIATQDVKSELHALTAKIGVNLDRASFGRMLEETMRISKEPELVAALGETWKRLPSMAMFEASQTPQ